MVLIKQDRYKEKMIIPGQLIRLENQNAVFDNLPASADFEEFLRNIAFQYLTAYPFKNLGKNQTAKMNKARKVMPLLADVDESDFADANISTRKNKPGSFTDTKKKRYFDTFMKKLGKENLSLLIKILQKEDFLAKELNLSEATIKRLGGKEGENLTLERLDSESTIQKVVGYEAGTGLSPSGKITAVTPEQQKKYEDDMKQYEAGKVKEKPEAPKPDFQEADKPNRTISLLSKFDKGEPIVDIGRNSDTFQMFLDNISIEGDTIKIQTEDYIKAIMAIHGYYDPAKDEWQFEMKDAPEGADTEEMQNMLDKILEGMDKFEDEPAESSSGLRGYMKDYRKFKRQLKRLEKENFLTPEEVDTYLQNLEDKIADTKQSIKDMRGAETGADAETGEGDIEEEPQEEIEVLEAGSPDEDEVAEKMMKAMDIIKSSVGQRRELKKVDNYSVEYLTPKGIEGTDKDNKRIITSANYTLKRFDGTELDNLTPREAYNARLTELTETDIKNALLSKPPKSGRDVHALRRMILSTITPSNGSISIGTTEFKINYAPFQGDAGYDKFLMSLQRKDTKEDSQFMAYVPELLKVTFILFKYNQLIQSMPKFELAKMLDRYTDEEELVQDLVSYAALITNDAYALKNPEGGIRLANRYNPDTKAYEEIEEEIPAIKDHPDWKKAVENPQYTELFNAWKKKVADAPDEVDMETGKVKEKPTEPGKFYEADTIDEKGRLVEGKNREGTPIVESQRMEVDDKTPPFRKFRFAKVDLNDFTQGYTTKTVADLTKLVEDINKIIMYIDNIELAKPDVDKAKMEPQDKAIIDGLGTGKTSLFYRPKGDVGLSYSLSELFTTMSGDSAHEEIMTSIGNKGQGLIEIYYDHKDYLKKLLENAGGVQIDDDEDPFIQPQMNLMWLGKPVDKNKDSIHQRQLIRTKPEVKAGRKQWRATYDSRKGEKNIFDKEKAQDVNALMKIKNNYQDLRRVIYSGG